MEPADDGLVSVKGSIHDAEEQVDAQEAAEPAAADDGVDPLYAQYLKDLAQYEIDYEQYLQDKHEYDKKLEEHADYKLEVLDFLPELRELSWYEENKDKISASYLKK